MAGGGGSRNRKKTYSKPSDPRHHSPLGPPNHPTPTSTHTPTSRVRSLARAGFIISLLILSLTLFNMWLVSSHLSTNANNPLIYTAHVVNYYPHDPNAFTQGLLYGGNDTLYESTGLYGRSSIRKVDLKTGKVKYQRKMDHSVFGEGLTLLGDRLYQLTWMQKTGFIYDRSTFRPLAQFTHPMNDGWGLATDGKFLFGSDGSSTLYQINPQSWKVMQKRTVKYKGLEVHNLNELEFVNGEVWANVFQTDCIARIEPGSGTVVGWIVLPSLRESLIAAGERGIDVLNGIAWDDSQQRIFVTGKLWPKLYEIKLHPLEDQSHYDVEHLCINMPFQF